MKRLTGLLLAVVMAASVHGQTAMMGVTDQSYGFWDNMFNHLDVGVTGGSTGVGFDVAMPVGNYVRLRTGMSFMPRVEVPLTFGIQVGTDPALSASKFNRLAAMLESFTGNPVEDHVKMTGKPTWWNWNVLVDVYPIPRNKHWRVTAGFFLGTKYVAESFNKTESMASLLAVDIYNNLYDKIVGKSIFDVQYNDIINLGEAYNGVYLDPDMVELLQGKLERNGRMGINLGTYTHDIKDSDGNVIHAKGDRYFMEPNEDHMVKAKMKVNAFKPYIGVGYDGRLVKGNDRLHLSVDAGVMSWGGTPSLITHDGTDLINDVEGVRGKVGRYVDVMSKIKAFPVVNVRFAYTIF